MGERRNFNISVSSFANFQIRSRKRVYWPFRYSPTQCDSKIIILLSDSTMSIDDLRLS